jgi:peptide subunit release factor 1 (eRF1)
VRTLTQDAIRSLAGFDGDAAPVVSLYLDVDGRRHVRPRDYEMHLDQLLRQAREQANGSTPVEDLQRIETHVKRGLDRSHTRGLAIFSCTAKGLWEVIELPVPVRNQIVVNQTPQVKQLEAIVESHKSFGVLLADKQRARMFVFAMGELVDKTELFDQLPRHDDDHGGWDKDHVRDHNAAQAHQHLRRAAQVAFAVFQERPFDHLIIGAPDEIAHEVERDLHSYLRERIAAQLSLPTSASEAQITAAALEVEEGIERKIEATLVHRVREGVGSGSAVAGLEAVAVALGERRVDTLVVSDGYEAAGWRCRGCELLAVRGPVCRQCGQPMVRIDDMVEEAVEQTLSRAGKVAVCAGNADLDVLGRIGAVLRF